MWQSINTLSKGTFEAVGGWLGKRKSPSNGQDARTDSQQDASNGNAQKRARPDPDEVKEGSAVEFSKPDVAHQKPGEDPPGGGDGRASFKRRANDDRGASQDEQPSSRRRLNYSTLQEPELQTPNEGWQLPGLQDPAKQRFKLVPQKDYQLPPGTPRKVLGVVSRIGKPSRRPRLLAPIAQRYKVCPEDEDWLTSAAPARSTDNKPQSSGAQTGDTQPVSSLPSFSLSFAGGRVPTESPFGASLGPHSASELPKADFTFGGKAPATTEPVAPAAASGSQLEGGHAAPLRSLVSLGPSSGGIFGAGAIPIPRSPTPVPTSAPMGERLVGPNPPGAPATQPFPVASLLERQAPSSAVNPPASLPTMAGPSFEGSLPVLGGPSNPPKAPREGPGGSAPQMQSFPIAQHLSTSSSRPTDSSPQSQPALVPPVNPPGFLQPGAAAGPAFPPASLTAAAGPAFPPGPLTAPGSLFGPPAGSTSFPSGSGFLAASSQAPAAPPPGPAKGFTFGQEAHKAPVSTFFSGFPQGANAPGKPAPFTTQPASSSFSFSAGAATNPQFSANPASVGGMFGAQVPSQAPGANPFAPQQPISFGAPAPSFGGGFGGFGQPQASPVVFGAQPPGSSGPSQRPQAPAVAFGQGNGFGQQPQQPMVFGQSSGVGVATGQPGGMVEGARKHVKVRRRAHR